MTGGVFSDFIDVINVGDTINIGSDAGKVNISKAASNTEVIGTTDSSSSSTGALIVDGGLGVAKKAFIGTSVNTPIVGNAGGLSVGTTNATSVSIGTSSISTTMCGQSISPTIWTALAGYSKSTYSPTLNDGAGHSFTLSTANGYFFKLGTYYWVNIHIVWTAKGSAVSTNGVQITLPVTAGASPDRLTYSLGYISGVTFSRQLVATSNASSGFLQIWDLVSGSAPTTILVSAMATSGELQISGFISIY